MSAGIWDTLRRPDLRRRLVLIALRYGARTEADAEDIVQDALALAYEKRASLHDPSRIEPWLAQIVLNAARMNLRARKRQRRGGRFRFVDAEELELPADEVFEERIVRHETLALVEGAITNDRDGALLREVLSWPRTLRELALERGEPLATLRTRLHRARHRVRAAIEAA